MTVRMTAEGEYDPDQLITRAFAKIPEALMKVEGFETAGLVVVAVGYTPDGETKGGVPMRSFFLAHEGVSCPGDAMLACLQAAAFEIEQMIKRRKSELA